MRSSILAVLLAAGCAQSPELEPPLAAATRQEHVTFRARLGNYVEGLTPILQTPSLSLVAAMDGYDVVAIPVLDSPPSARVPSTHVKLFDVRGFPAAHRPPRGIAFDPGRQQFYFGSPSGGPNPVITVTDRDGRQRSPITLTLLPGQVAPIQFEGLVYLPPGLPRFGDRIAAVLIGEDSIGRISIVRLDGTVEYEVPIVPGGPAEAYVTGLGFVPPDRFLFTPLLDVASAVYQVDLAGNVTGPVLTGDPAASYEGIVPMPGGRVAVSESALGRLFVYDAAGARLPWQDRDFHVGPGLLSADSIAWDSGADRLLVSALVGGGFAPQNVHALQPPFEAASQVTHLEQTGMSSVSGLAYLPDEGSIAVCEPSGGSPTRGVWFFDAATGDYRSRLALASFERDTFRPRKVTPLPDGQLALRVNQHPELVQIITRGGAPDPADPTATIPDLVGTVTLPAPQPLGATGIAFDQALGQLLVGRQYVDLDGTELGTLGGIPADFFGNTFIRLTSGPYAGQIAGIDSVGSELVIFRP